MAKKMYYTDEEAAAKLGVDAAALEAMVRDQKLRVFKDGDNTYDPPTRDYHFDVDFLTPALLPPRTPMFRDVNTLTFRQLLRPNQ